MSLPKDKKSIKIVLLGDSGVGKTSIVTRYVSGTVLENVKPTVGAAFVTKDVIIQKNTVELLIWDTAGQEVYRGLAPIYYRNARIAIIVFDVTNSTSFDSVNYWIGELKSNVSENVVILVCANKIDLNEKRIIDQNQIDILIKKNNVLYAETSAKENIGIDKLFQDLISKITEIDLVAENEKDKTDLREAKPNVGCAC